MKDRDLLDLMGLCQLLAQETRSKTIELACRVIVGHCRGRRSRRHRTPKPLASPFYNPIEAQATAMGPDGVPYTPTVTTDDVGNWTPAEALPRTT